MRINHDERHWTDPMVFNPDRFYNKEDNEYVPNDNLVTFGVGKRSCLGQNLAEKHLFFFLVQLVKAFKFEKPISKPLPPCGYNTGNLANLIRGNPPFTVLLKNR